MNRRPLAVTIVAWVVITVGAVGFVAHAWEGGKDVWIVIATELVALVAGVFLLRAANWARWLAIAWIAFHVAISFGSAQKLIVHSAILIVFAVVLFHPSSNAYFRRAP